MGKFAAVAPILVALLLCAGYAFAQSAYQQAAGELQRENPQAAIAILEPVLKQQPGDLRALTLKGIALTALGRPQEANQVYQQALTLNPQFAPALRGLAMNEMAAGNAPGAKKHFQELLKLTPSEPLAHLAMGEIEYGDRQLSASVQHFENSESLYLSDPRLVLKFADAAIQTRQPAKAEAALVKMPSSADPEQHLQAGLMLVRMEKFEPAAREFELAMSGKDAYLAGYNLALAQLKAAHYDQAIKTTEDLVAKGFRTAEVYNVQAQAHEKSGRTKEAYEALRTATIIDPGDETNYLDLIAICLDHKNLDLALDITKVGLTRLPKSERLQLQKGIVWAMKGDFDQAKTTFAEACKLSPNKSLPQVALGLVLLQMDQADEAVRVLRQSSTGKEDRYLLDWFLAEALSRTAVDPGSPEEKEAVTALERAIRHRPDLPQPHVLLGKYLLRRGELDAAVTQLELALQLDPANTTAVYHLAQAYRKKGDTERANELFAKVSKTKNDEREELTRKGLQLITEGAK